MNLTRVSKRTLVAGCLACAMLAPVGAADAAKPEKIPYSDTFDEAVPDFCGVGGLTVDVDAVVEGVLKIRTQGGLEYWSDRAKIRAEYTANGVTVTELINVFSKDLKVEAVGDTLVIVYFGTGTATLYGPDGRAIARNPGQTRFRVVLDAATGDELEFEVVKESTGRNDDFCGAIVPVLTG